MKVDITIPSVGESVTEATIARLIKPSGSHVEKEEEILELETDKVNQLLYAPASGELTWQVKEQESVKVGQTIGSIETESQKKPSKTEPSKREERGLPSEKEKEHVIRKKEEEYLDSIAEKEETFEKKQVVEKPGQRRERMTKLRKIISQRLMEVRTQTAMLTTFNEVDMSQIVALRNREKENFQKKYGIKLGFTSFFVKASISALQEYPELNAFIDKEDIVYLEGCHIGVAVGTEKGLLVPVIKDAQDKTLTEIEIALKDFAEKARKGNISVDHLQGGSFTITNGGIYGSLLSTPILNYPQSAILGLHTIQERPIAINGKVEVRPMMYLALSYDHRIVDGKEAISFLVHIKKNLEDPTRLLLDS